VQDRAGARSNVGATGPRFFALHPAPCLSIFTVMSAGGYFSEIADTMRSVWVGMKITLRYCFQRTATVNYPEHRLKLAPRYRGIHEFEADLCIACDLCVKACPVDCIYIDKTAPRKIDKATGKAIGGDLVRFAIDYSKCMFCALCTEPCPTQCIHMGKLHDLSCYSREDVVVEFTELDKQNLRTPIPLWMEKNKDDIAWVGEEYRRVKSGRIAPTSADIPQA
jgi:NADH-quinone oxidoreductase subunit I